MIASKTPLQPDSGHPLPNSAKVYQAGEIHPGLRVPFRQITLSATKTARGASEPNEPVRVYDCSGPWGDASFEGDVDQGLPALRRPWILARGDVEEVEISYKAPPRKEGANGSAPRVFQSASRRALRAKTGKVVTQLEYARRGIITPEMEFIAIRENLGREENRSRAA